MSFKDSNLKRELIMFHYLKPSLKESQNKYNIDHYSNHCVDELHIKMEFKDNVANNVKWDGKGCAIFQASTDIFLLKVINKNIKEIITLAKEYEKMINQEEKYDETLLDKLLVFENVKNQLNRLNCANMVSQAILKKYNN